MEGTMEGKKDRRTEGQKGRRVIDLIFGHQNVVCISEPRTPKSVQRDQQSSKKKYGLRF